MTAPGRNAPSNAALLDGRGRFNPSGKALE